MPYVSLSYERIPPPNINHRKPKIILMIHMHRIRRACRTRRTRYPRANAHMHNMQIALGRPIIQIFKPSADGSSQRPLHGAVALGAAVGHVLGARWGVATAAPGG